MSKRKDPGDGVDAFAAENAPVGETLTLEQIAELTDTAWLTSGPLETPNLEWLNELD